MVSIDLAQSGKKVFSFKANRSGRLEPSMPAPWTQVLLDSPSDPIASKMVALVERGAPRDFRDVHAICSAGLAAPAECWELWKKRLSAAGEVAAVDRARLAVQSHLSRIERHRPLEEIEEAERREAASAVRTWLKEDFLDALVD